MGIQVCNTPLVSIKTNFNRDIPQLFLHRRDSLQLSFANTMNQIIRGANEYERIFLPKINKLLRDNGDLADRLFENPIISKDTIGKYLDILISNDYFRFIFNPNTTIDILLLAIDKIDKRKRSTLFYYISRNSNLTKEFIKKYSKELDISVVIIYSKLPEKVLEKLVPSDKQGSNSKLLFPKENSNLSDKFYTRVYDGEDSEYLEILSRSGIASEKFWRKNIKYLRPSIVHNWNIPENIIEMYISYHGIDSVNIRNLSRNRTLSLTFVEKYIEKLDLYELATSTRLNQTFVSKHISRLIAYRDKFPKRNPFPRLTENPSLDYSFILYYFDYIDKGKIFVNPSVSDIFIRSIIHKNSVLKSLKRKFADKRPLPIEINWQGLSENPGISPKFIKDYWRKLDIELLVENMFIFDERMLVNSFNKLKLNTPRVKELIKSKAALNKRENRKRGNADISMNTPRIITGRPVEEYYNEIGEYLKKNYKKFIFLDFSKIPQITYNWKSKDKIFIPDLALSDDILVDIRFQNRIESDIRDRERALACYKSGYLLEIWFFNDRGNKIGEIIHDFE